MQTNNILFALSQAANAFYAVMVQKTSTGYPKGDPKQGTTSIPEATRIEPPQMKGNGASIDIVFNLKKAPYIPAFEWGSGIHGEKGQTYTINPKNASYLAWHESRWPGHKAPRGMGGWFVFSFINHPGIAARPFIIPSINEAKPRMREIIGQEFKSMLTTSLREIEIR